MSQPIPAPPRSLSRRAFLGVAATAAAAAATRLGRAGTASAAASRPLPTPAQLNWQDAEVGVIFHFDMPVAAGDPAPNNLTRRVFDPDLYRPAKLDTDQWAEAARAAGARYAIFTATHFNGFLQWPSDAYPYGVRQSRWRNGRGDVVGDFIRSCHRAGLQPGLYLSTHRNAWWTVWGHYVNWGKGRGTRKQKEFNRAAERMVTELCSRYGKLIQIWFDAGVKTPAEGGPDVLPIFERLQPDSVFYSSRDRSDHRWIGNERGHAGVPCWATMPGAPHGLSHNTAAWKPLLATGDPAGGAWAPGMVDIPLRGAHGVHDWFWRPDHARGCHPLDDLLKIYEQSVGRNCNLVIGAVVNRDGLVPETDARRLAEFGTALRRRFGKPLARARGTGRTLELALPQPAPVGWVAVQEDIRHGERVREYVVEARAPGGDWARVADGQSIGHRWIHRLPGTPLARLRVRVLRADGKPHFRALTAYATG